METPNVNNLNGIPNFGHGFDEPAPAEAPAEVQPEVQEETPATEVDITNQE